MGTVLTIRGLRSMVKSCALILLQLSRFTDVARHSIAAIGGMTLTVRCIIECALS
jgi:hypothetical protein